MPASIASKLKKKKRERKEERHLFHGKANWNCCLSSEELLCGEARVHLWANPSAYVIGVDKLHVEVSLGYHGNLKGGEFWFSGSQQKDISVCCVTGLCRGERKRQKCIGKLLSDEFWPASDMVLWSCEGPVILVSDPHVNMRSVGPHLHWDVAQLL